MAGAGSRKGKSKVFQKNSESRSRIARQVNLAVNRALVAKAEKKFYTNGVNGQNTSVAGTVWAITQGIIQGDSVLTRDGRQITLQEVGLKIDVFMPTAAVASGVRIILFSDRMNLGSLPGIANVLSSSTLTSPYSLEQNLTSRFAIHADIVKNFTAGGIQQTVVNIQRPLKSKVTYNGDADVAAANGKHSVFFLILTDSGATVPTYDFTFHVRFGYVVHV